MSFGEGSCINSPVGLTTIDVDVKVMESGMDEERRAKIEVWRSAGNICMFYD